MGECDENEDKVVLPAQQLQQPQPAQNAKHEGLAARVGSLPPEALNNGAKNPGEGAASARTKGFDQARFTAGIVRFYEAVLKEPIPEKMLRLVQELAKRERQS